jgi:hypothetical protein
VAFLARTGTYSLVKNHSVRFNLGMETDLSHHELNEILDLSEEVAPAPLELLPALPWRSLGGFFNYERWPERERFLLLDREIDVCRSADL